MWEAESVLEATFHPVVIETVKGNGGRRRGRCCNICPGPVSDSVSKGLTGSVQVVFMHRVYKPQQKLIQQILVMCQSLPLTKGHIL